MEQAAGSAQDAHSAPGCYRHPDRETGVRCTRCERPICPECMVSASVGFQCPDCVRGGAGEGPAPQASRPRTLAGGTVTADPRLLTKILIGINLAMFVAIKADPSFLYDVVLYGGLPEKPFTPTSGVAGGEWYRFVSSMFAHEQYWHIGFNMLSLWWVGGPLEAALGRARYLAVYLVSGLAGGALTYLLADPAAASLGASGALYGLFGATAVLMRRLNYDMRPVIALLVINLIFTFNGSLHIAWQAHIGGLVAGVVTGYAMVHAPRERRALVQYGTCAVVLALALALALIRTAQLT
ncbi:MULTISPECIES: rhomboid family intramembrane serine protease [Streptomyces]|uniref:rhomboid family intramembrane serine protease n=1 Tax=Streptomyces TaxID=1883 RepID=UPI0016741E78|nr:MULTISPECIES: rhomboid family intramembrane serine protease [Streptomyces]MBK3524685.1 rhomboid family intramembrane serine protease [Streptomyces sp. MBT70]GGR68063.1 rhomboid family intramembrane serine protease [Streptomyces eurythermus]